VSAPTLGVEEEFHVVDPVSRRVVGRAPELIEADPSLQAELLDGTIETGTAVCQTLGDLRAELVRTRRALRAVAEARGLAIGCAGTLPLVAPSAAVVPPLERYRRLEADYGLQAREQLLCGTHTHVTVADPDVAVRALAHLRPWLHALIAISASSPTWNGVDTGFASWRTQQWRRWPVAGDPVPLQGRADYDALVADLVASGAIADAGMLYWDARPSGKYPTIEVRIADAGSTVDDVVLVAALSRALVASAVADAAADRPPPRLSGPLVAVARWRAARHGLDAEQYDPVDRRLEPASHLLTRLTAHCADALDEAGDRDTVEQLLARLAAGGGAAARQRRVLRAGGGMTDLVDHVVAETAAD
jgi:carboxylate-amine ligase